VRFHSRAELVGMAHDAMHGRADEAAATTMSRPGAASQANPHADTADYPVESERDPVMAYNTSGAPSR